MANKLMKAFNVRADKAEPFPEMNGKKTKRPPFFCVWFKRERDTAE